MTILKLFFDIVLFFYYYCGTKQQLFFMHFQCISVYLLRYIFLYLLCNRGVNGEKKVSWPGYS